MRFGLPPEGGHRTIRDFLIVETCARVQAWSQGRAMVPVTRRKLAWFAVASYEVPFATRKTLRPARRRAMFSVVAFRPSGLGLAPKWGVPDSKHGLESASLDA